MSEPEMSVQPTPQPEPSLSHTAGKSVAHLIPGWAREWGHYLKANPTPQKLLVICCFVLGIFAYASHIIHGKKADDLSSTNEKMIKGRDATITAQQNTLSTNANTIEGLRSENTSIQRKVQDVRQERDTLKANSPVFAAGNQYFANLPTAERLSSVLNVINGLTNIPSDVRTLMAYQNRKADLGVFVVGVGAGWSQSMEIYSNALVYVPIYWKNNSASFHLILKNNGDLPAEAIHTTFTCPTGTTVSAASPWENQSGVAREFGNEQFISKADAVYPSGSLAISAISFSLVG